MKEADRLSIIRQIEKNVLSIKEASEALGITLRQVHRLKKRYDLEGPSGLISKRRGIPNARKFPDKLKKRVIDLMKDPIREGWGPTFASEKLSLMNDIHISKETLRHWMIEVGLWQNKRRKQQKIYQRRTRRSCFGEMLQGDGSPHDWFEGRGERCTLLIFVDDATSFITSGKFFPEETTDGYLEVLEQQLRTYGRPSVLYVDKNSVFRKNQKEISSGDLETHFGKVLRELDIKLICANSPQAKGRVERANSTLQDRLIKEMRLRGISSIEEANEYLPTFIADFNKRFGREPAERKNSHRLLPKGLDLERVFARKYFRKLSKELSFSFEGTTYHLQTQTPNRIRKTHVEIIKRPNKPLIVELDGKPMEYTKWKEAPYLRTPVLDSKQLEALWRNKPKKPNKNHPWR